MYKKNAINTVFLYGIIYPDDEEPFLISEPEKPGNKGKFVVTKLSNWRFYLKFISIQ